MTLKFCMTPGSCSTGIHILLETLELPFEAWIINLPAGEHLEPAYLAINPNGTIPTLVLDDGTALTDFQSIAVWLAETHPRSGLLPEDPSARDQALDLLAFALTELHGNGYTRVFTPERHIEAGEPAESGAIDAIKAEGRLIVAEAFAQVETRLPEQGYAAGPSFTIADAALFYTEFWADRTDIPMPPRVRAHYERVLSRPVVRRVLAEEGYRP